MHSEIHFRCLLVFAPGLNWEYKSNYDHYDKDFKEVSDDGQGLKERM